MPLHAARHLCTLVASNTSDHSERSLRKQERSRKGCMARTVDPTFLGHHVELAEVLPALSIDELEGIHTISLLQAEKSKLAV